MEFIKDQEKRILLAAISREKRVIKEHPELEELLPVIERLDHYFMYDRLFNRIYNQALEDMANKIKEYSGDHYIDCDGHYILPLRGYFTIDDVLLEWKKEQENDD